MQSTTLFRSIAGLRRVIVAAACCLLLAVAAAAQSEDGGRIEIPADQITCACASGGTGSISVIAEGSAGPFSFLWAGPGGYVSTEQNPADLPAPGQYSVTVTNAYGCAVTLEAVVPECPSIQLNRSPNIFHPTSCTASDGIIRWLSGNAVSGGTPPFSFAWDNGATSLNVSNLSPGTHTLTITDSNGCRAMFSYVLNTQSTPVPIIQTTPTCSGSNDGAIIVAAETSGNDNPSFNFFWSNGFSELNTNISELSNLAAGTYMLTITEVNSGCTIAQEIEVEALTAQQALSVNGSVSYACSGGSVNITPIGGITPYDIKWSIPGFDNTSTLSGLRSGTYCVTVTDFCGAGSVSCFVVESAQNPLFEIGVPFIQHVSTPGANDGSVFVSVMPVSGEYNYLWSTGSTSHRIGDLAPGTYTVSVTDKATGCVQTRSFQITECAEAKELDVLVIPEFEPVSGRMTFNAMLNTGDGNYTTFFPPGYFITWLAPSGINNDVIGTQSVLVLPENYMFKEVWLRVTNGCKSVFITKPVIDCQSITSNQNLVNFFVADQVNPCAWFNDGEILLTFPILSNGELFEVYINDLLFASSSAENILHIGGLPGNVDHHIRVIIGDCSFEFTVRLPEQATRKEFRELKDELCLYDEYCGDMLLSNATNTSHAQQSIIDYSSGSGLGFIGSSCQANVICPAGIVAGTKTFKKRTARMMEYVEALNAASQMEGVYSLEYLAHIRSLIFPISGNECRSVRFCDKTLFPLDVGPVAANWLGNSGGTINETNQPGCLYRVNCGIFSYTVCPQDFERYLPGPVPPLNQENCFPMRMNALQLLEYRSMLLEEFEETFDGSQVEQFLLVNASRQELACASIIFCRRDFSIISHDLDIISCGDPVYDCNDVYIGNTCEVTPTGAGQLFGTILCSPRTELGHLCRPPMVIRFCLREIFQPQNPPPVIFCPRFITEPTEQYYPKLYLDSYQQETLSSFGLSQSKDALNPKGLVQTEQGFTVENFNVTGDQIFKQRADTTVVQYVEDWDKELIAYVEAFEPGHRYSVAYEDTTYTWRKELYSSDTLMIKHLSVPQTVQDELVAGGEFIGKIYLNGNLLAVSAEPAAFVMKLGFDGSLLSFTKIEGMEGAVFSENRRGDVVVGAVSSGTLLVGTQDWSTSQQPHAAFVTVKQQGNLELAGRVQLLSGDFELLDISVSNDSLRDISFVLKGDFTASFGLNETVGTHGASTTQLVTMSRGGSYIHHSDITSWADSTSFDFTYGNSNELYFGVTLRDTAVIQGHPFISAGGTDILLLRLSSSGQLNWFKQYGNTEDQTVSRVLYDREALFFGGNTNGAVGDQKIGKYIFSNLAPAVRKSYISLALPYEVNDPQELAGRGTEYPDDLAQQRDAHLEDSKILVFPNPFGSSVQVRSDKAEISTIVISNILGQLVYSHTGTSPFSELEINTAAFVPGIYYIRFSNAAGIQLSVQKIVKSKP